MKLLPILAGLVVVVACHGMERTFQVTFQVVNDEGEPVIGAKTAVSWENAKATKPSERIKSTEGVTDQDGCVTLEGKTFSSGVSYGASKEGYYAAWGLRYHFKDTRFLRWQPWNPTIEVVLKRKKNPVPMYAKRLALALPKLDEPVGYDFMAGDWTAPHGRGRNPDMIFVGELHNEGERKFDWRLHVTFPNPGDGIQRFTPDSESAVFRSAYEAPAEGYSSEWKLRRWRDGPAAPEQTTFDRKGGYFFRIRAESDKDGKVTKALYGKIYGDFFDMTYYLNPDGTRNMEYDPKRNLLQPSNNRDRSYYEVGP